MSDYNDGGGSLLPTCTIWCPGCRGGIDGDCYARGALHAVFSGDQSAEDIPMCHARMPNRPSSTGANPTGLIGLSDGCTAVPLLQRLSLPLASSPSSPSSPLLPSSPPLPSSPFLPPQRLTSFTTCGDYTMCVGNTPCERSRGCSRFNSDGTPR
jgi:hypothetical protein